MAHLTNREVAALLTEFARRFEPGGANPFSARAYLHAAESVLRSPTSVGDLIANNQLLKLHGVGRTIAGTIMIVYQTGTHPALDKMRARQIQQEEYSSNNGRAQRCCKRPRLITPTTST